VRTLVERCGLDPHEAATPPTVAVALERLDLLEALLDAGSASLRPWDLTGPLRRAVELRWMAGVERLIVAGADPALVDLPTGPGTGELRALLVRARSARSEPAGPVAAARALEGGARGAAKRWLDRLGAALVWTTTPNVEEWRGAAAQLGLRLSGSGRLPLLEGTVEGLEVRAECLLAGRTSTTRIAVGGPPEWLTIRRESVRERLGTTAERLSVPRIATRWMKTNDVVVGEERFDERIEVQGPAAETLALLSHPVRSEILDLVDGLGGNVASGCVSIEVPGHVDDRERLVRLVRAAHALARALALRVELGTAAGLAENAGSDPSEYVRTRMLATLGERFPGSEETIAASRNALRTARYDWHRMTAAANLGDEAIPVYRSILEDTTQSPDVRGMALRHLGWRGGPAAETLVLGYLDSSEPPIALHAVRILGERAGTAASVEPLLRRAGPLPTSELARAAARAVKEIQSRLTNAAPGQLSLAGGPTGGEVSLASASNGGEVSLSAPSPGSDGNAASDGDG
jgi:hypothetical protein